MTLSEQAKVLARLLAERKCRVVFAESCTAGLVSASLAQVPGISAWHCGSAVTYREATKEAWIGVNAKTLARHSAVSRLVACQMARGVLEQTPEADWSASITGHLGPGAPAEFDGVCYIAVAKRAGRQIQIMDIERCELEQKTRVRRQREAASLVLAAITRAIR